MNKNICVCLMGVDGSGKTTIAKAYLKHLEKSAEPVIHVWSRYRNYFSKPFLALMRVTGHNRKEVVDGVKIGYHDFSNNKVIACVFLGLQWLDQYIDITLRFRFRSQAIVSDRCVIDTLVDLCIDTGMDDFILGRYGRSLLSLMPQEIKYFLVARDKQLVYKCRPDVKADANFDRRVSLYNRVASTFDLIPLNNNGTMDDSLNQLCKRAG